MTREERARRIAALGKIGIVLPGGVLRGAFQAGALEALQDQGIRPSYIVGVSVGALNAAAFACGKLNFTLFTYEQVAPRPAKFLYDWNLFGFLRLFSRSSSILSNSPLRRLIRNLLDFNELFASDICVDIITSDLQDGEEVVFSNQNPEHRNAALMTEALLASAAMPSIFPPLDHHGHQLSDGGVIQKNPISHAVRNGCDTIFVILTDPHEHIRTAHQFETIYSITRRAGNLDSWRASKKDIAQGTEINENIAAYDALGADLKKIIEWNVQDPTLRIRLLEAMGTRLTTTPFSFQKKRAVRIIVVEPDSTETNESYAMFHLIHKTVPQYIEEGHRKMEATLRGLNIFEE